MATAPRAATPTVVSVPDIPARQSRIYLPNRDNAEPDLEMQNRQGARNRREARPLRAMSTELGSTSESETTLTPTSTIGSVETEVPRTKPSTSESCGIALGKWVDNLFTPELPTHRRPDRQEEYDRVKRKELKDSVNGIPRLASFQNSSESFFVFRKFGNVATRILFTKQIELYQLITKLEELDIHDAADHEKWGYRLESIEHYEKWDKAQWELMQEIESKLNIYYDFYLKLQKIRAFGTAEARDHRNLHDWIIEHNPIVEEEKEYLFDKGDFMSSRKQAGGNTILDSQLATFLRDFSNKHPHSFLSGFFREREESEGSEYPSAVIYRSRLRFQIATKVFIAALSIAVILVAVLAIWLGSQLSRGAMGALVILFGLVFAAAILAVTSRELEIFMGIAGCFAVVASVLANSYQGGGTGTVTG